MVDEVVIKTERPEWLPENFKGPEDFRKSYDELQAKLTTVSQESKKTDEAPADTNDGEGNENTSEDSPAFKESVTAAAAEWSESGELSEDTYKSLEDAGLPKELVDQYIAGQKAVAEGVENTLYNAAGGKDNYAEMVEWAAESFTPEEIKSYNDTVNSGDIQTATMAIENLKNKYADATGTTPTLVKGSGAGAQAAGYRSWAEVKVDMGNPKYASDPAFRSDVQAKLQRSQL